MADLTDGMLPDKEKNESVFTLLLTAWHLLGAGISPDLATLMFELRMMALAGYHPETTACVNCREAFENVDKYKFSSRLGGILCSRCFETDTSALVISPAALAVMKQLLRMTPAILSRLKVAVPVSRQLDEVLFNYISCRIEKNLRSREFLLEIKRLGP